MANQTCSNCKHYIPVAMLYGQCGLDQAARPVETKLMRLCTPEYSCKKWKVVKK